MRMITGSAICAILAIISISSSHTQNTKNKPSQATARESDIARGKYLVEEVAKCAECHTPRDAQNQLDPDRWLQGAPNWITSVKPAPKLGGPCPNPGRFSRIYRQRWLRHSRKRDRRKRRSDSSPDAHLPLETRRCRRDYRLSPFAPQRSEVGNLDAQNLAARSHM